MLPQNWTKYTTDDGKAYYHNHLTNQTQWEFPVSQVDIQGRESQSAPTGTKAKVMYGIYQPSIDSGSASFPCSFCIPSMDLLYISFDVTSNQVKSRLIAIANPIP